MLLLRHFIVAFIVFFLSLIIFWVIESLGNNDFYIFLEKAVGYDFAYFIHDYEPSIIFFGFVVLQPLYIFPAVQRAYPVLHIEDLNSLSQKQAAF